VHLRSALLRNPLDVRAVAVGYAGAVTSPSLTAIESQLPMTVSHAQTTLDMQMHKYVGINSYFSRCRPRCNLDKDDGAQI
jgi:hypothetical protein